VNLAATAPAATTTIRAR